DRVGEWVAVYVAKRIQDSYNSSKPFVLGLPTGSTPLSMYKKLIELNKLEKVSFKNVVTFNMDEYIGLPREHPASYHTYMFKNFFDHIDIPSQNINILDGMAPDLEEECKRYERKIEGYGGIDLFVGGVGEDGHIAFNEPGSSLSSRTRIKELTYDTRLANARFFGGNVEKVPKSALTVGVGTILRSKEVLIMASGYRKAVAVYHAVEDGVNHLWTVSALQLHEHATLVCDDEATMELKVKTVMYFKDIEKEFLDVDRLEKRLLG
ncbi:MAG: glucosamine-6-phosphate deaminase, partial [Synergistetes bacterium]|nr:glucosamine-6-phosphate deaminase [Synergistota bacterium]